MPTVPFYHREQQLADLNRLVCAESSIYLPHVGGVRHSDTVLVTQGGYELLTHFPTDLDSLTVKSWKPMNRLQGALVRRAVGLK